MPIGSAGTAGGGEAALLGDDDLSEAKESLLLTRLILAAMGLPCFLGDEPTERACDSEARVYAASVA